MADANALVTSSPANGQKGRNSHVSSTAAIQAALELFWSRGFAASSLKQLEDVTGMNPGSLYYRFNNKEQLYTETLRFYITHFFEERIEKYLITKQPTPVLLKRFFTSGYRNTHQHDYRRCCFLITSSHELHLLPKEVQSLIHSGLQKLKQGFRCVLNVLIPTMGNNNQNNRQAEALINQLLGIYISAQVLAKMNQNQRCLDYHVHQGLHSLLPTEYPLA